MRYLLKFSYDGSSYDGYQKQKDKKNVQGSIEEQLTKRFNKFIKINASGRTDKSVHAINQYAHFDVEKNDISRLKRYLNTFLDKSIYIKDIKEVNEEFDARRSVKKKTYMYEINTKEYNVFKRNYQLQYCKKIDIKKIEEIILLFIGEHDFENFTTIEDKKDIYIRTIYDINIKEQNGIVRIYITGSGFLRFMVRNIVGTFLMYNDEKLDKEDIIDMIQKKTNVKPVKVDGCGLYLFDVIY